MKAVTIAKITRWVVIIAVVIVLAIPTYGGAQSLQINGGEFVSTESVYELNCMSSKELATNIMDVTNGGSGYTIAYGSVAGRAVPTAQSEVETMATEIKAAEPNGKATLMKPDGSIAKQMMIMGSGTEIGDYSQYIFTGLKLSGTMVDTITPTVTMDSYIGGVKNKISDVEIEKTSDSYRLKMKIPYVLMGAAIVRQDARVGITVGMQYSNFFDFTISMSLSVDKITAGSGASITPPEVKKDVPYSGSNHSYDGVNITQEVDFTAPVSGVPQVAGGVGSFGSGDGGVRLEVEADGSMKLMSDKENLLDALQSAREPDGSLTINLDGGETYKINGEQVDSLMSMYGELIKGALS